MTGELGPLPVAATSVRSLEAACHQTSWFGPCWAKITCDDDDVELAEGDVICCLAEGNMLRRLDDMVGWICMFFARRFSQMHRIYRSWRDDSKSIGLSYCQCGYCWCPIRTCNFPICNFSASSHLFDGVGGGWESAKVISDWLRLWATRGFGAELKGFARGVGKNHPMPNLCLLKFMSNQSITCPIFAVLHFSSEEN